MINTMSGKEVVPQNTADTMILEAFADALDEKSLPMVMPLLQKMPAAAQGILMARLEQIMTARREEQERLAKTVGKMDASALARAELGDGENNG